MQVCDYNYQYAHLNNVNCADMRDCSSNNDVRSINVVTFLLVVLFFMCVQFSLLYKWVYNNV